MSSQSLAGAVAGVNEVRALRTHYPVSRRGIATGVEAAATKAHGRACVVLLCSHFERYIHSVNEEAIEWLNAQSCTIKNFPPEFLLLHSRGVIDKLAGQAWNNRGPALQEFAQEHAPLWSTGGTTGGLDHEQLLVWMKAPHPKNLIRFYKYYGIDDVFGAVTRQRSTRGALHLGIKELVEKRNNIAHGDAQTEALPGDVTKYLNAVSKFTESADKVMARALRAMAGSVAKPW